MKIILSRKGFDTVNGGCPSPIMPDGTLLSLPIPSDDALTYSDIAYNGLTYHQLLRYLNPKKEYQGCHLDPDILSDTRLVSHPNWEPAFGQIDAAQGMLHNCGIGENDLFLFFGMFRHVEKTSANGYRYFKGETPIHLIFGYLQIGQVLTKPEEVEKYSWHPHADLSRRYEKNNALYLPRKALDFDVSKPGCGIFKFSKNRILTMPNKSMATWHKIPALMPDNIISKRKNSAADGGFDN